MHLDTVIFLIVAAIVIISQIRKMKGARKPDKRAQPQKKTGWKATVEDLIAEVHSEMEKGRTETGAKPGTGDVPPRRKTGWEDIIPAEIFERTPSEPASAPEPMMSAMAPEPEPAPVSAEPEDDVELTPTERMEIQRKKAALRRGRMREKRMPPWHEGRGFTVRQLQHAVIWSEILAPPVGMRDLDQ